MPVTAAMAVNFSIMIPLGTAFCTAAMLVDSPFGVDEQEVKMGIDARPAAHFGVARS
jgi:hypothetical protein